ncbi:g9007 [Coccomyxa elongata]
MFKRQEWLHLQGQHGSGASDSDSESDEASGSEGESSDDSEDVASQISREIAAPEQTDDDEGPPAHRLEDLSEDDFDSNAETSSPEDIEAKQALTDQKKNWLEAPKAEQVKGRALTCMVCKGSLLLNGESLKQHLGSKKHLKQLKLFNAFLDPICFAGSLDDDSSDAETHAERATRIAQQASALQRNPKEKKRKRYNPEAGKKRKGKKPGKRQRLQASKSQAQAAKR